VTASVASATNSMGRTIPNQATALDILDWLYFNQALVFCTYKEPEWVWLYQLVDEVKSAVAHSGATGIEAECLKHTVLCLMEIGLHDPLESLPTPEPIPLPAGLTPESHAEFETFRRNYFMGLVIAVGEMARSFPLRVAIDIAESLLGKFSAAPVTIKYRLVERCLAFEYMLAPLEFFSWLLEQGVICSQKFQSEKATVSSDSLAIVRIGLLCEFETLRHSMIALTKHQGQFEGLLKLSDKLSSHAVQQLLENMHHYQRLAYAESRTMIAFNPDRIREPTYVRHFLDTYRKNCFRTRLISGTQAKWLGMLGATMVSIYKTLVGPDKPIYIENSSSDSVTKQIEAFLQKRGCTILPRTLYENYRQFVEETRPRVEVYNAVQVQTGATPPVDTQDIFYNSSIAVHN
jgi:hypothetical protein